MKPPARKSRKRKTPVRFAPIELGDTYVQVPVRIVSEANRNGHHWGVRKKRFARQRLVLASALARAAQHRPPTPCIVQFVRLGPGRLDRGNLEVSFKGVQDEVALWLGVDDGDTARVQWRYSQHTQGTQWGLRVEWRPAT